MEEEMSSHADTIRPLLAAMGTGYATPEDYDDALAALDALLAENQRLRDALDAADWLITNLRILREGGVVRGLDEANAGYKSAREALAGDGE
jgi:hypothetical protein